MAIYQLGDFVPTIDPAAYVTDSATLVGQVHVEAQASVWFNVTIRGDNEPIIIGEGSNVQEGSVLHADPGFPLTIGKHVTIGHMAMVHGCTIGDGTLVGIQAVILNGARIGKNCVVGAGALVTEGKEFPDNSLIVGTPAKAIRMLDENEIKRFHGAADSYIRRSVEFREKLKRIG